MREDRFFWQRSNSRSRRAKSKRRRDKMLMHKVRNRGTNPQCPWNERDTLIPQKANNRSFRRMAHRSAPCHRVLGFQVVDSSSQRTTQEKQQKILKHKAGITKIKHLSPSHGALFEIFNVSLVKATSALRKAFLNIGGVSKAINYKLLLPSFSVEQDRKFENKKAEGISTSISSIASKVSRLNFDLGHKYTAQKISLSER